jgi:uncharacterized YccA/Bax inhibitor family protein
MMHNLLYSLKNPLLKSISYKTKSYQSTSSKINSVTATLILFIMTVVFYIISWNVLIILAEQSNKSILSDIRNFSFVSGIVAFSLVFFARYKPRYSMIISFLYVIFATIFISGFSYSAEQKYPGIAILTFELTMSNFLILLIAYQLKIIQATSRFKAVVYSSTLAIGAVYLLSFILMFFEIKIPLIHGTGMGSILWSMFVVTIVSMNLIVNFELIEKIDKNAPSYMHWYAALGLMTTLIWLYFATLRLLVKVRKMQR